jgi:hypothetical protein
VTSCSPAAAALLGFCGGCRNACNKGIWQFQLMDTPASHYHPVHDEQMYSQVALLTARASCNKPQVGCTKEQLPFKAKNKN